MITSGGLHRQRVNCAAIRNRVGHGTQPRRLTGSGRKPFPLILFTPEFHATTPATHGVWDLFSHQFPVNGGGHTVLGGHIYGTVIAQPGRAHATLGHRQCGGGEFGIHTETCAQHLKQGRPCLDQHRLVLRLRHHVSRKAAFLEPKLFLTVIRKGEHRKSGNHHGGPVCKLQLKPRVRRHTFDGAAGQ